MNTPTDQATMTKPNPKLGLTNLETAEKRRRIAEISWQVAQLRHEAATLKAELAEDKARFPR